MIRPLYHRVLIAFVLLSFIAAPRLKAQDSRPVTAPPVELTPTQNGVVLAHILESFSTLSLDGSDFRPETPLLGGKDTTPHYVRELVRVQWRPNDPIDLYVIRPVGAKNPPVVLYLYSFPTDIDHFKDDRFCQRLVQNGAAAVGFVSALTGYRYSNRPMNTWFISEMQESLASSVHDVQLILNYLGTRDDLDMNRVGMFGQGSGGAIAILAAATDPRIKAIDLLDPWGDWPYWFAKAVIIPEKERATYLKPEFLKKLEPLEPVRYLPTLSSRSVRIQFLDDEMTVTKEAMDKLAASAPPTATVLHYPNGHAMYAVSSNGRLFEWLPSVLKAPTETKEAAAKTPIAMPAR